jgi:hypothetical protein
MDVSVIQNLLDNFVPENMSSSSPLEPEEIRPVLAVMNTLHLLAIKSWSYVDLLSNRLRTREPRESFIQSANSSGKY